MRHMQAATLTDVVHTTVKTSRGELRTEAGCSLPGPQLGSRSQEVQRHICCYSTYTGGRPATGVMETLCSTEHASTCSYGLTGNVLQKSRRILCMHSVEHPHIRGHKLYQIITNCVDILSSQERRLARISSISTNACLFICMKAKLLVKMNSEALP